MSVIHFIKLLYSLNQLHAIIFGIGCFTSVINHRYTSAIIKWTDRTTMTILLIVDMLIMHNLKQILYMSVIMFIWAKIAKIDRYHLISHILITIFHIMQ